MVKFFLFLKSFFGNKEPKPGDWLIYIDDVDINYSMSKTSLVYGQVVKLIEIKYFNRTRIVDVGIRFTDGSIFTYNENLQIPGMGIKWLKFSRFRIATDVEVDRWMSENDIEYCRDKKINQILDK